jgi:hypothetical protein
MGDSYHVPYETAYPLVPATPDDGERRRVMTDPAGHHHLGVERP